jgi:hypothetical protein
VTGSDQWFSDQAAFWWMVHKSSVRWLIKNLYTFFEDVSWADLRVCRHLT